jgi:low affinity Fe/Cu permease
MSNIIASGQVTTGNSVTLTKSSDEWQIVPNTAVATTVTFDDKYVITIPATVTSFTKIPGNYQKMAVSGATINYIVYG